MIPRRRGRILPFGLLVLAVLLSSCDESARILKSPSGATFEASLTLLDEAGNESEVFAQGEPITFSLTVRNLTSEPQTIRLGSSQRFDFTVSGTGDSVIWHWSRDKAFLTVLSNMEFAPEQTRTFGTVWTQVDDGGNETPAAKYDAQGYVPVPNGSNTRLEEVSAGPVRFEIR